MRRLLLVVGLAALVAVIIPTMALAEPTPGQGVFHKQLPGQGCERGQAEKSPTITPRPAEDKTGEPHLDCYLDAPPPS